MLTAAQRADLQRLRPLPLRTLALNASSGSLSSIHALHRYCWSPSRLIRLTDQTCGVLLPVLLVGLDPSDIPDYLARDLATETLILRANYCLELISLFAKYLSLPQDLTTFISTHHHRIFPWLTFLSVQFVGTQELSPTASRLRVITNQSVMTTVAGILSCLNPSGTDLQSDVLSSTVDVVVDIWRKLLYIEISSVELQIDASLLTVHLGQFIAHLLASPTSNVVIDKLGGRSSIVVLWLTHIEQTTGRFAILRLKKSGIAFKALTHSLVFMFACFADEDFGPEIGAHNVMHRISVVVNQLIEHYNAVCHLPLPNSDNLPSRTLQVVYRYCCFILTDPWAFSPPRLLQSLKSGTLKYLRSVTRIKPSQDAPPSFDFFVDYMIAHSTYPAILRHTCKLLEPFQQPGTDPWSRFDQAVGQYGAVWNLAGEVAQRFEKCSTCMVPRCQRELKICSGCRTILYCSAECQRIGRYQGHRLHCKLFQLSQAHSSLIGGCRGFLFLALLETNLISYQKPRLNNLLASTTFSPDEIPLILIEISAFQDATITKMADYPHIFKNELWEKELEPRFRAMMDAGQIPKYLSVFSMPRGSQRARSYALGAAASGIASGLLDADTLSRVEVRL